MKFEQGKIDISFNENLSKDFIKNLSQKLIEWTGKRWIITLSKDQGQTTVHEIKQQVKAKLIEEMKQTDEYKKILEAFPDAELIDVQDKEED